jgi:hypothetical protein
MTRLVGIADAANQRRERRKGRFLVSSRRATRQLCIVTDADCPVHRPVHGKSLDGGIQFP